MINSPKILQIDKINLYKIPKENRKEFRNNLLLVSKSSRRQLRKKPARKIMTDNNKTILSSLDLNSDMS